MSSEQNASRTSVSLETYVVGFFDLLGQQERLRGLTQLPDKTNQESMAAARDILIHTYGAVREMRSWFQDTFNTYARKPLPTSEGLSEEQRRLYEQMNSNPIEFRGISDSMVVFVSLRQYENTKLPARAVLGVLVAAGLVSMGCMKAGHPIRGGIDLGVAFKTPEGEIYGPALSRAYSLESNVAGYPRVIVGHGLVNLLRSAISDPEPDIFGEQSKLLAEQCWKCLVQDDDGNAIVDYLGPHFRAMLAAGNADVIDEAYDHVIRLSAEFKKAGNTKLAFRYTLLRNYFESRMPLWADLPRKRRSKG